MIEVVLNLCGVKHEMGAFIRHEELNTCAVVERTVRDVNVPEEARQIIFSMLFFI